MPLFLLSSFCKNEINLVFAEWHAHLTLQGCLLKLPAHTNPLPKALEQ
jgi:hypothetical protein